MKAAILEKIEDLKFVELDKPEPARGEILVRVKACAICGTDIKIYHHGHKMIQFPRVTGHEVSGIIEKLGEGVGGYKTGDRVAVAAAIPCGECHYCRNDMQGMCDNLTAMGYHYNGGFEEYMAVPEVAVRNECVNYIPENVSFEEASIAEPLACCINGQELSGVKKGDVVVVIGSGPIGSFHIELARAKGASKTMLADISKERLGTARGVCKPDVLINSLKENLVELVKSETGGRGAEVVITACSSGKAQEQALEIVAKRGNVNFFGGLPKDNPCIRFNSNILHYGEVFVVGTHGSAPKHNRMALDMMGKGNIKAKNYITAQLPLAKLLDGIKMVENAEGLKTIIRP